MQNEETELSSDDILSAALSEAGLDEFVAPTSEDFAVPSVSTCVVVSEAEISAQPSQLASPSTASTGSSPDLPVDGTSHSTAPSTSSAAAVNDSKIISGITASPGITARPSNTVVVAGGSNLFKATGTLGASPARFLKYIDPSGKTCILPMAPGTRLIASSPTSNIRLVVSRKAPVGGSVAPLSAANMTIVNGGAVSALMKNPATDLIKNEKVTSGIASPNLEPIMPVHQKRIVQPVLHQQQTFRHRHLNHRLIAPQNSTQIVRSMQAPSMILAQAQQAPNGILAQQAPSGILASSIRHPHPRLNHPTPHQPQSSKRTVRFNPNVDVQHDHHHLVSKSFSRPAIVRNDFTNNRSTLSPNITPPPTFNVVKEEVVETEPLQVSVPSVSQRFVKQSTTPSNGTTQTASRYNNSKMLKEEMKKSEVGGPSTSQVRIESKPPPADTVKQEELNQQNLTAQDDVDEEEDLGQAETYSEYMPAKLRSGLSHPDPVVETSSLSSVAPPDVHYHVSIPEHLIDTGKLSALQLEAIIYACQQHEMFNPNGERVGYLIGDGAGVGKGRTIAGLIYENYLLGRKRALWFSVSSDLKYDAERDLADIGAEKIKVHALNKFKYSRISGKENGGVKKGVIFATYSSLIGESSNAKSKYRTRLKQIIHWCGGRDFDGPIVFDECHRAKNLVPTGSSKPTKTGQIVLELQKELPKARVVYASATGATETRNMAYMTRLGLWGPGKPFKDFMDFITAIEKRGVGAMEIVAMDMKQRGLYLARQLSFSGTSFRIEEVSLSKEFIHIYDESVKLWLEARKQFQTASELVGEKADKKSMWGQFWAAHQRFFKYLCIAAKVSVCVRLARESVKNGKCVVIGLQSTGETKTLEQLEECGGELNDFVSTAKSVFLSLIEKHFPVTDPNRDLSHRSVTLKDAKSSLFGEAGDLFGDETRRTAKRKIESTSKASKRAKLSEKSSLFDSDKESDQDEDDDVDSKDSNDLSDGEKSGNSDSDVENDSTAEDDDDSKASSSQGSSNEDSDEEEETEHFNPFADEDHEDDMWEAKLEKLRKKKIKEKKRHKKPTKEELEEVDELGKQLEEALEESDDLPVKTVEEKKSHVKDMAANVDEFLQSSSSFFESAFDSPDRFCSNFGMSQANLMKAELLAAVERLGDLLPANTLDQLIDELGGPEYVAEMTGRKGRVVSREDGEIQYELRNDGDVPLELLNLTEKERFMNGQKHIAIISEAASSGISLQSDRRAKNQRRRVHITLELPWSADKAIQQFGRTHRSNQVNAPEYVFLISELAGEHRFASVVAKRLESLGALTHGDRRATESRDLSQFNLDTKYGRAALELTLKSILGYMRPLIKPPVDYKGNFYADMRQYLDGVGLAVREADGLHWSLEKDVNMSKFLNRILGLPVYAQNTLFQYFSDTLRAVVDEAKRDGRYDMGIMDLGSGREQVKKVETRVFIGKLEAGGFRTELHLVSVERGLSWDQAHDIYVEHSGNDDGFYVSTSSAVKITAVLICAIGRRRAETNERLFNVFRPNTGLCPNMETLAELRQRYKRVTPEKAKPIWNEQYDISSSRCQHAFWYGKCRNEMSGMTCEVGKRKRSYYILSGSVLSVWNTVENVLNGVSMGKRYGRMQVVRVRTDKEQKIVGILIPNSFVRAVVDRLSDESSRTYVGLV